MGHSERIRDTHEAFGQVSISQIDGRKNLFGVDWPQDHFMRLTITTAERERSLTSDYIYEKEKVIAIDLSQVQWAALVSSPNRGGVACTIHYKPEGPLKVMAEPPERDTVGELFKQGIDRDAAGTMDAVNDALKACQEFRNGKLTKGGLDEVISKLRMAKQDLERNLPWVVERAHEEINKSAERGKAEFQTFVDMKLRDLGGEALRERISGSAPVEIGVGPAPVIEDKTGV